MLDMLSPDSYPRIEPVSDAIHRPYWSVMIPTYNRPTYLERTLKSVIDQDFGGDEVQIEVVDNCSNEGNIQDIVDRLGGGRVSLYRQSKNIDVVANFNTCINRAFGHWIHIMHDDDVLLPGFYIAYRRFIAVHQQIGMMFSRAIAIDENDEWIRLLYTPPHQGSSGEIHEAVNKLAKSNFIVCPSAVVLRQVYETTGGFNPLLSFAVDGEMWIRIALSWPIGYIHQPMLLYRVHPDTGGSSTVIRFVQGGIVEELKYVADIGVKELPFREQNNTRKEAYRNISLNAHSIYKILLTKGIFKPALPYAYHSLVLRPSVRNFLSLLRTTLQISCSYLINK